MTHSESLAASLLAGNRRALAKAITLIESSHSRDRKAALELLDLVSSKTGNSIRIGISGSPGVGKSTFIEAFGLRLIDAGHRVCVLTIDPSSRLTGGSILGDKTRMNQLSNHADAYIRPTPSGARLGGVARRTREVILLAEAAGFDIILIETVGVGQSEISVADMSDLFMLLLQPASGDDLQGIKRGVMELADMIVVNKADGKLEHAANSTASSYLQALSLMKNKPKNQDCQWSVPVLRCSSTQGDGLDEIQAQIKHYISALKHHNIFDSNRLNQAEHWFNEEVLASLQDALETNPALSKQIAQTKQLVRARQLTPVSAATQLIETLFPCSEN